MQITFCKDTQCDRGHRHTSCVQICSSNRIILYVIIINCSSGVSITLRAHRWIQKHVVDLSGWWSGVTINAVILWTNVERTAEINCVQEDEHSNADSETWFQTLLLIPRATKTPVLVMWQRVFVLYVCAHACIYG